MATILIGSVVASLIWPKHIERNIDVDLPEGFGRPFENVEDEKHEDVSQLTKSK